MLPQAHDDGRENQWSAEAGKRKIPEAKSLLSNNPTITPARYSLGGCLVAHQPATFDLEYRAGSCSRALGQVVRLNSRGPELLL
jgi:hypothetical protein